MLSKDLLITLMTPIEFERNIVILHCIKWNGLVHFLRVESDQTIYQNAIWKFAQGSFLVKPG